MGKVWLVSSGSYSDYGIRGVFSSVEAARTFADYYNTGERTSFRDAYELEEWEIDQPPEKWPGAFVAFVEEDGTVSYSYWDEDGDVGAEASVTAVVERGRVTGKRQFIGIGTTVEHARRSAEELRRATIAGTVVTEPNQG